MNAETNELRATIKQIGHLIGLLAARQNERFAPELMADPASASLLRELAAGIEAGQIAGKK